MDNVLWSIYPCFLGVLVANPPLNRVHRTGLDMGSNVHCRMCQRCITLLPFGVCLWQYLPRDDKCCGGHLPLVVVLIRGL